jgi:hypothetical protein
VLRYDENEIPEFTANDVVAVLNEEYARLDLALGCGLQEQLIAVVQSADSYRAATGAADWSGGQFDGRIRVVLEGRKLTPRVRQALAHEMVHACIARNGQFPRWFHEGMAQRWSNETPDAAHLRAAQSLTQAPVLDQTTESAQTFYAWAWWAVDELYRMHGDQYVRNLLRAPEHVRLNAGN